MEMERITERCYCDEIIDKKSVDYAIKAAALRVSPSVVSVITHDIPDDMIVQQREQVGRGKYVCPGSGIIIQTQDTWDPDRDRDASYSTTVLCPAHLFKRTNSIQPHQIEVEVRVSGSKLYKGELLACDFHYNIAALRIKSDTPLRPATLRHLSDLPSLDDRGILQRGSTVHSFNVQSGTKILIAKRSWWGHFEILVYEGVLSTHDLSPMRCKELLSLEHAERKQCKGGGAIINYHGEVVGLFFRNGSFLPLNLVLRWWDHYESCREFRRPCLAMNVANLYEAHTRVLNRVVGKIRDNVAGVVVKEVEEGSAPYLAKIKSGDVIIKCNGDLIRSKLELLEIVWANVGRDVEFDVLKAHNGDHLKLRMSVGETAPHKLYEWGLPDLYCLPRCS